MSLPPLANFFAVRSQDPRQEVNLRSSGEFAKVWRPSSPWVVGIAPLPPGGDSFGEESNTAGLVFAEGRDRLFRDDKGFDPHSVIAMIDREPGRLDSLPGDFTFLRIRPDCSAIAARSCGGLAPVYWKNRGGTVAVGTRLDYFVRYLEDEPVLDPLVNAVWTSGHGLFPDNRTFLKGISILPAGHYAEIENDGDVRIGRYWDPRPARVQPPTEARLREHAAGLREILFKKLERDLDSAGGNLLSFSGGVDSSSLLALAAAVGKRVSTVSLVPPPGASLDHERSFIDPLLEDYEVERSWFFELSPGCRAEMVPEGPPAVFHVMHPILCLLPQLCAQAPIRVLFGGEFADQICGSILRMPDWAAHTSPLELARGVGRLPTGPADIGRWTRHRVRSILGRPTVPFPKDLPDFVKNEVQEEYREWRNRRQRAAAADDRLGLRHLAMGVEASGFLAMNWEASSEMGVRRSFPFVNREVLELAFDCHPRELVGPGEKRLIRKALADDVPARNLFRSDKGRWGRGLPSPKARWHRGPLPDELRSLVKESWFPEPVEPLIPRERGALVQLTTFIRSLDVSRKPEHSLVGAAF